MMHKLHTPTFFQLWSPHVQAHLTAFWAGRTIEACKFRRLEHLKGVLLEKAVTGPTFRGLIFVQERVMTHVLKYFIDNDARLSQVLRPACLYAVGTPATATLKLTQSESQRLLGDFGSGLSNLLICTSAAEEGMDIPAANCVIRFDPVMHSVSLIQGRGRARQEDSSHVVLAQRFDRTVDRLTQNEKSQAKMVETFDFDRMGLVKAIQKSLAELREQGELLVKHRPVYASSAYASSAASPSVSSFSTLPSVSSFSASPARAQLSSFSASPARASGAQSSAHLAPITHQVVTAAQSPGPSTISVLNEFAQKSRGHVADEDDFSNPSQVRIRIRFTAPGVSLVGVGAVPKGSPKKDAKQLAAAHVLQQIIAL
eukprot:m.217518 g.217518  ORF g.217518 m.217518 type:complete len:370 (-) comp54109_c0_seq2:88-1197(-)